MPDTVKIRVLAPNFVKRGSQPGDEFDVDDRTARNLIQQGRAEYADPKLGGPSDAWTKRDLEAYASERGINLDGASRKDDVLSAIQAAESAGVAGNIIGNPTGAASGAVGQRSSGPTTTPDASSVPTPVDTSAEQS